MANTPVTKGKLMFKLTKSKWHHEITHFPMFNSTIGNSAQIDNFCEYTRMFLWKLLIVIPMTILITGWWLGWYTSSLVILLTTGDLTIKGNGAYGMWLWWNIVVAGILGLFYLGHLWDQRSRRKLQEAYNLEEAYDLGEKERPQPKPDGFLTTWYKAVKGKYCPPME